MPCSVSVGFTTSGMPRAKMGPRTHDLIPPSHSVHTMSPSEGPSTPDLTSSSDEIVTPAPVTRIEIPDAPPPIPPAKELPSATPASSATPSLRPQADLAEFDPYATPVAGESSNTRQTRPEAIPTEPMEPAFNFSGFLKDLRTKSAEPVARYLKR